MVLTLSVIALAQDPPRVRFFFDTNGAAEQADRGAGDLSFVNPVVSGSDRLYLYGQFLSTRYDPWVRLSFDIEVAGGGLIAQWHIYNHATLRGPRWQARSNERGFTPTALVDDATVLTVAPVGMFVQGALTDDPKHFRSHQEDQMTAFGNTLLGFIDVDWNGSDYSEVRLGVGAAGFDARHPFPLGVAFGFGDEDAGIETESYGMQSPIADATIVPEPAALGLMLVAASLWRVLRR